MQTEMLLKSLLVFSVLVSISGCTAQNQDGKLDSEASLIGLVPLEDYDNPPPLPKVGTLDDLECIIVVEKAVSEPMEVKEMETYKVKGNLKLAGNCPKGATVTITVSNSASGSQNIQLPSSKDGSIQSVSFSVPVKATSSGRRGGGVECGTLSVSTGNEEYGYVITEVGIIPDKTYCKAYFNSDICRTYKPGVCYGNYCPMGTSEWIDFCGFSQALENKVSGVAGNGTQASPSPSAATAKSSAIENDVSYSEAFFADEIPPLTSVADLQVCSFGTSVAELNLKLAELKLAKTEKAWNESVQYFKIANKKAWMYSRDVLRLRKALKDETDYLNDLFYRLEHETTTQQQRLDLQSEIDRQRKLLNDLDYQLKSATKKYEKWKFAREQADMMFKNLNENRIAQGDKIASLTKSLADKAGACGKKICKKVLKSSNVIGWGISITMLLVTLEKANAQINSQNWDGAAEVVLTEAESWVPQTFDPASIQEYLAVTPQVTTMMKDKLRKETKDLLATYLKDKYETEVIEQPENRLKYYIRSSMVTNSCNTNLTRDIDKYLVTYTDYILQQQMK